MQIAVLKEGRSGESRVAATPDTARKLAGLGAEVVVAAGAGSPAGFTDQDYVSAGARIAADAAGACAGSDIVFKVRAPMTASEGADEITIFKPGAILIAHLSAISSRTTIAALATQGVTAFALELM